MEDAPPNARSFLVEPMAFLGGSVVGALALGALGEGGWANFYEFIVGLILIFLLGAIPFSMINWVVRKFSLEGWFAYILGGGVAGALLSLGRELPDFILFGAVLGATYWATCKRRRMIRNGAAQ